jgi:AAA family ATP:ADP antiporter
VSEGGASYTPLARAPWLLRWIDVRPGEGAPLAWSIGYFFCLLLAYYLLRPLREAFGIASGWENLAPLMTGTLLAMLAVSPLFAWLVSRVPRRRFLPLTYRFLLSNLLVFYLLLRAFASGPEGTPTWISYVFYVWLSVFNVFAVSVFWSFLSDVFTSVQAKRLFGLVGLGGTLGSIAGAAAASALAEPLGTPGLMLLAALALEAAARCVLAILRRTDPSRADTPIRVRAEEPGRRVLAGLQLVLSSRYLQCILVYVFVYGLTNTFIYMEQGRIVESAFPDDTTRTQAFARLDFWQTVAILVMQIFLSGRVMRWIGLGPTLMIVPAVSLLGFAALSGGVDRYVGGAFTLILVFQVVRRALHFAVDRPAREVLFTVVDADARYKSKSLIDTFVFRAGDMVGGWTARGFALAGASLGFVAIPVAAVGLGVGLALGPMQARRQASRDGARRVPGEPDAPGRGGHAAPPAAS